VTKRNFKSLLLIATLTCLPCGFASAQGMWPNTTNVNDCTLLRDPDQTRRCIEAYQGAPPVPNTSPSPQGSPLLLPTTPSAPQTTTPQTAPPPRLAPR
jgi:hypothetical protein